MNLANFISLNEIKPAIHAGGPGSGKHKELTEAGFKKKTAGKGYVLFPRSGAPSETYEKKVNNGTVNIHQGQDRKWYVLNAYRGGSFRSRHGSLIQRQVHVGDDFDEALDKAKSFSDIKASSSFKDTGIYNEKEEADRRNDAMFIGYYAENGPTYDPSGKYLCGSCKHRVLPNKCTLVEGKISMNSGGCMVYEIGPASANNDIQPNRFQFSDVAYTERPNVKAFGCTRCEYGKKAIKADAGDRSLWCSSWGMHVMPTACCMRNEGDDDTHPKDIDAGGPGSGRHRTAQDYRKELTKNRISELAKKDNPIHNASHKHLTRLGYTFVGNENNRSIYQPRFGKGIVAVDHNGKYTEIKAGGPGSGRHPWGRKQKIKQYRTQLTQQQTEKYKQFEKTYSTPLEEGSLAKLKNTTRAFNNKTLEFQNYKPGTVVTVINVLPKIGNNPQMVSVKFPHEDVMHMPEHELSPFKTPESQKEKPYWDIRREIGLGPKIRPGQIEQKTTTSTGATYMKLKLVTRGRPPGSGNIYKGPAEWKQGQPAPDKHPLKGQFEIAKGARGQALKDVFTFDWKDIGQINSRATVFDANRPNGSGATVIAWRDTKDKVGKVVEFNRDENGYIKIGGAPATSFKNLGHFSSYLKQRYGISMTLPGESVAKKGKRIKAGGVGSGCNPAVGVCGPHPKGTIHPEAVYNKTFKGASKSYTYEKIVSGTKKRYILYYKGKELQTYYGSAGKSSMQSFVKSQGFGPPPTSTVSSVVNKLPEIKKEEQKELQISLSRKDIEAAVNTAIDKYGADNLKLPPPSYAFDPTAKQQWDNLVDLYNKVGLTEQDLKNHAAQISKWSGSANKEFAELAQKAVYSKNYSDPATKSMAIEYFVTQKILSQSGNDAVTLYRGIKSTYAQEAKQQAAGRTMVVLTTRGADSWTSDINTAKGFGGTILSNEFPIKMIVTSYKSNSKLHNSHPSEKEFVVVTPGKELHLPDSKVIHASVRRKIKIDVSNDEGANWLHSMRKKK